MRGCLGCAWDDVIGALLDPREVRQARLKEVGYLHEKHVYTEINRAEAQRHGIKILRTRRVDVYKGDVINPNFCSGFVALKLTSKGNPRWSARQTMKKRSVVCSIEPQEDAVMVGTSRR